MSLKTPSVRRMGPPAGSGIPVRSRTIALIAVALTAIGLDAAASAPTRAEPAFANVQLSTGVDLHYAVQGDPSGKPMIMLHGYTDSWFSFSELLPLIPASYRAYALDQRGHGKSSRSDAGYAMEDMVQDVVAFLDAMGIDRATIVGHSMGSFVAQQVALAAPKRVDRLVLIASAATPRSFPGVTMFAQAVNALPDPVPVEFAREFQESTVFRKPSEAFMDEVVRISTAVPADVWRGAMIGMLSTDPPAGLAALDIPTLVLWGEHDSVFLESAQDALRTMLPAARFRAYAGIGHAPHWEQPDIVARDLLDFLNGKEPA